MKIEKKENYMLFTSEEKLLPDVLKTFFFYAQKHTSSNIIFAISKNLNITVEDFSLFLETTSTKRTKGTSFIIIISSLDIDRLPEEINVVPTLQEAEDILEMENIERELGF